MPDPKVPTTTGDVSSENVSTEINPSYAAPEPSWKKYLQAGQAGDQSSMETAKALYEEQKGVKAGYRDLFNRKSKYVKAREVQIYNDPSNRASGLTPQQARDKASKEFDEQFLIPLTNEYSDKMSDNVYDLIGPLDLITPSPAPPANLPPPKSSTGEVEYPSIFTAIAPQEYVSPYASSLITPYQKGPDQKGKDQSIDFDAVTEALKEKENMPDDIANVQSEGIRQAYLAKRRTKTDLSPEEAFNETLAELQNIGETISGRGAKLTEEGMTGPANEWYQTFVIQKKAGSVPDLSPAQLAYFDYIFKNQQEKIRSDESRNIKENGIPYVKLPDGTEIPEDVVQAGNLPADIMAQLPNATHFMKKDVDNATLEGRVEQRLKVEKPDIWWADPVKKPQVLANPEAFYENGILSSTTPMGGTVETPAGWLLRSTMTIPNMVAGYGSNLIFSGEELSRARKEKRAVEAPLYENSPVLLNVAENRGFTGEFSDAADLLHYSPAGKIAMTATGFALDLLDPSFGLIEGGLSGAKAAAQVSKASKAIYGMGDISRALTAGGREALATTIRSYEGVPLVGSFMSKAAEGIGVGDIRAFMGADLTASLLARDIAREELAAGSDLSSTMARLKSEGLSNSTYATSLKNSKAGSLKEAFAESENVIVSARKFQNRGTENAVRLIDDWDGVSRSIDNISEGKLTPSETSGIKSKELANSLGAMASSDERIMEIFKNVDAAPIKGIPKIYQYVEALGREGKLGELKRVLAYDKAIGSVYRSTKDIIGLDNMIAITKNTWATKKSAAEILNHVKNNTELGKIVSEIVSSGKPITFETSTRGRSLKGTFGSEKSEKFSLSEPTLKATYSGLSNPISERLSSIVEAQVSFGKIDPSLSKIILNDLSNNKITTEDLRLLLENTTDLVAEAKFANTGSGARGRDLSMTSSIQQMAALEPLELRSFGKTIVKDFINNNTKEVRGVVSIQQRKVIAEVQQKVSAMDEVLRSKMIKLSSTSEENKALRALYGLDDKTVYTKSELLSALIVGPIDPAKREFGLNYKKVNLRESLNWSVRRMFYSEKTSESILDSITGIKEIFQNKILNTKGQYELDVIINKAANSLLEAKGSTNYWNVLMNDIIPRVREIVSNERFLLPGVFPSDITDVAKISKKLPVELQVATYYASETGRLMEESISKLIVEDQNIGRMSAIEGLDPAFARDMTSFFKDGLGIDISNVSKYQSHVKETIFHKILDPKSSSSISDNAFVSILESIEPQRVQNTLIQELKNAINSNNTKLLNDIFQKNKSEILFLSEYARSVDDTASTFIRSNGLEKYKGGDIVGLRRDIEALFSDDNAGLLKGLLGSDVYFEMKKAISEGKLNDFSKQVDFAIRNEVRQTTASQKTITYLSAFVKQLNSLRYYFTLSLRTRFHGANIATADLISYMTIGKMGVGEKTAALNTFMKGSNWGSTEYFSLSGLKSPGGIPYTHGEIYDAVIHSGIRSETGFVRSITGDQVVQLIEPNYEKIVNYLKSKKMGKVGDGLRTTIDFLKSSLSIPSELGNAADIVHRIAIVRKGINEGRSLEEAISLGRESLFDYSKMTDTERAISAHAFIFYSFQRQNFATLLRSLVDPALFNRYLNIMKMDRAVGELGPQFIDYLTNTDDGERFNQSAFLPDYAAGRAFLRMIRKPYGDIYVALPPIPAEDAWMQMGSIIGGDYSDIFRRLLNPALSKALNISSTSREWDKVLPEHVHWASLFYSNPSDIGAFLSILTGEKVIPVRPKVGSPDLQYAVNGWIYPLTTEGKATYKQRVEWLLEYTGVETAALDYARIFSPEGSTVSELSIPERIGYSAGILTPMKISRPEKSEAYSIKKRIDEINARISSMKKDEEAKKGKK